MNDIHTNDEIDLLKLIQTIWDSKWKIIAIAAACVLAAFSFQFLGPAPSFVAKTEIKPIIAFEAKDYRQSNALGFFAVYPNIEAKDQARLSTRKGGRGHSVVLDQMFIEQLGNRQLLASIFKKYELLVRDEFDSDLSYERALMQLAATVAIIPPVNKDGTQSGGSRQNWTLQFEFSDEGNWLAALAEIKDTANKNVRNAVKWSFESTVVASKQMRAFDIEDLDIQIAILKAAHKLKLR